MLISTLLWSGLALSLMFSAVFGLTLWVLLRWRRQEQATLTEALRLSQSSQSEQSALLDKALALLASGDALTYQQIQVMNPASGYDEPAFDPSDAGEIDRIRHTSGLAADQGDLSDYEQEIAGEFGLDAGFGLRAD